MKPAEILGLLEEAAGTRMYEAKKQAALKTIEKKASKVDEINTILAEDITPTLEKLRKEQTAYLQWASNNTECERLARFCVANEYSRAKSVASSSDEDTAAMRTNLAGERDTEARASAEAGMKDAAIQSLRSQRDGALAADLKSAEARAATASKALVSAQAAFDAKSAAAGDDLSAVEAARAGLAEAQSAASAAAEAVQEAAAASAAAAQASAAATAHADDTQEQLAAVSAGFAHSSGGTGATAQGALMAAKRTRADAMAASKDASMRLDANEQQVEQVTASLEGASGKQAGVQRALDKAQATLSVARHTAQDADAAAAGLDMGSLKRHARDTARTAEAAATKLDAAQASLGSALNFTFDGSRMPRDFDPRGVKGVVANLISVADPSAATAIEVAAGGKLFNVVVDNEATGKALLKHGRLQRRVTLIPISSMQLAGQPTAAAVQAAAVKTKGKAVPALSLVGYPEEVEVAMRHVLGRHFIAETSDAAKAVAFEPSIRMPAVTKAGDVFDPNGTLEGGAARAPGASILLRLAKVADLRQAAQEAAEAAADASSALQNAQARVAAATEACTAVAKAEHEVESVRAKLGSSEWGRLTGKKLTLTAAGAELRAALAAAEDAMRAAADDIARLQGSMAGGDAARASEVAKLEGQLADARAAAEAASAAAQEASCAAETAEADLVSAQQDVKAAQAALADAQKAAEASAVAVDAAREALDAAQGEADSTAAALAAKRDALSSSDSELQTLLADRDAAMQRAAAAGRSVKKLESDLKAHTGIVSEAKRRVAHLLSTHGWIAQDQQYFGKPGSDYDFEAQEPVAAAARLGELEAAQSSLGANLNKKVLGMMETAEREYAALMTKKQTVENDKAKIQRVIAELDDKKTQALTKTWTQVNADFGSIFSTLLPGVTAKLEPAEGGEVADGLEVRVAFGTVWKESLTELSGGQRSLLALSLILALLRFKPAPLYLLDEVDAALDLSHTQNIGAMLRSHFGGSQFLVVSLKQGMFSNANVIFRTKFVDGSSAVTRTVPDTSALLEDGGDENTGAAAASGKGGRAAQRRRVGRA